MVISLRPHRLDLDIDRNRLANARHRFRAGRKHQVEIPPRNRISHHTPAGPARFIDRRQQFNMERDRLGHAMHREIAENVAALRPGSLYASAFERDLGKFFRVKEFRASEMVVAFFDVRVDAPHVDMGGDRGILRMLAVHVDFTAESCEFAVGGAEKLMHREANC